MSAHVICITSGAGLPIFSRKKGSGETLPFSIIGSLNGVHMFGKAQKLELKNTLMDDYCTVWKEFYDSVILIGISSGCTTEVLHKVLQTIFNAMVLIVGIEEIKSQKNIERLKRELRLSCSLIDSVLDSLDCGNAINKQSSSLIMMTEVILYHENSALQTMLESYSEYIDSIYCCILIHGKIAVATESWWSLHKDEVKLLSLLAVLENTTASKDIPVFLPYTSPNIAYRFTACMIIPNVQVCCLCGPTPLLEQMEHFVNNCFKSNLETLESAVQYHPRNFPSSLQLEPNILSLLIVNIKIGKYMISSNSNSNLAQCGGNGNNRLDILKTFYYQAVLSLLESENENNYNDSEINDKGRKSEKYIKSNMQENTSVKEIYWCSEYHKCHALLLKNNLICVLYTSSIPTYSMSLISEKTLKLFINDKQLCW